MAEVGLIFVASVPSFDKGTPSVIHVLDAGNLRPIRQIQLPRRAFALALDRSTGRLYAGNTMDGSLTVIDAKGGQILDTIQLGLKDEEGGFEHIRMIALDEDKGLAFVRSAQKDHDVKERMSLPAHPNSLEVSENGQTLFLTVKAPLDKAHPDYREGRLDSLLRIDLERLGKGDK
ncbi:hypothetical protein JWJ88_20920 (plasmid) [Paracoccus methylovorus]|uniref:YncE family protein n=1 Tax=Paracoccus methylovorus TaxID=2812658 RepID=A0ABX7JSM0_9RHOB|nr:MULTISPECIES: hypothetical protein [Paracoccus]QRZ16233.1 hypothetical protein JWJ88_20920 [Paracoccus methylovorus]